MVAFPALQEVIEVTMLLPSCLLHPLLELMIVISFFFFLSLSLHVEQDIWIQSITLAAPHPPAWCVFFDTPEEIRAEDSPSPIPPAHTPRSRLPKWNIFGVHLSCQGICKRKGKTIPIVSGSNILIVRREGPEI